MQNQKELHRGEIYLVDLGNKGGSIQGFMRPMIIASNELACKYSPVLHAIPTTSQLKRWLPTHVEVSAYSSGLLKDSTAMCEQIQLLPREMFSKFVGCCTDSVMKQLDRGIAVQFGLVDLVGVENKNKYVYA
jgi:mRNA interferase MazF